jgi:PASTA domain-containing protein
VSDVTLFFDNDADGALFANGDDFLLVNPALGGLVDAYSTNQPPCPAGNSCTGILDTDNGGTADGIAATTNNGTYSFYEMSHPVNSNDDTHDFSLSAGDLVGADIRVSFCDGGGCSHTDGGQLLFAVAPLPNGKANQRIIFPPPPAATYGDPASSVTATATSRLPVLLAAGGKCTVSDGSVTVTGAGSCTLTASQPGDAFYNPAADVTQTFAIAKATQDIDFPAIAKKRFGTPDVSVRASASSGLPVRFAAGGRCTARGTKVHLTGVGKCTLTASQAGNSNYLAAKNVSRTFQVAPPRCRVPNVVGKRLADAKRAILRRHCRTGRVSSAYSPKKSGTVISQSRRRAGRILPFRARINLVVSRG